MLTWMLFEYILTCVGAGDDNQTKLASKGQTSPVMTSCRDSELQSVLKENAQLQAKVQSAEKKAAAASSIQVCTPSDNLSVCLD